MIPRIGDLDNLFNSSPPAEAPNEDELAVGLLKGRTLPYPEYVRELTVALHHLGAAEIEVTAVVHNL